MQVDQGKASSNFCSGNLNNSQQGTKKKFSYLSFSNHAGHTSLNFCYCKVFNGGTELCGGCFTLLTYKPTRHFCLFVLMLFLYKSFSKLHTVEVQEPKELVFYHIEAMYMSFINIFRQDGSIFISACLSLFLFFLRVSTE